MNNIVEVSPIWEQDEPDGSQCEVCEDLCLTEMRRMILHVYCLTNRTFRTHTTDKVVCGSCFQAMMEGEYE